MKIGIIGAGIAGLAAAVRMASRGYNVEVYEANSYPGGKLSSFDLQGYRFDAGPSLFTMPHYVDELFAVAKVANPFRYERLPVVCEYFWEDGARITAYGEKEKFAAEVQQKLGIPKERIIQSLQDSQKKYNLTGSIFLEKSLHRLDTWLDQKVLKALFKIPGLDIFTTMNQVNQRLLGHPKLVQLFNRFATYNGSNPYKVPGLLSIIPHFEHQIGTFYPEGGMHAITESLFNLAKQKGVQFFFNAPVKKILVYKRRVTGLEVNGEKRHYDRIISNMDVFFTYKKLLKDQKQPRRILGQEKSTSAIIFYWGIKKQFPELDLHNIFFNQNYRAEFDHLERGKVYNDPTVYVNISQKYTPEDAPSGCENWFTMINAPFNNGQDWDTLIDQTRKNTIAKLSRILNIDLESLIECEALLDPRLIEQKTASHLGALYGTSSNNRFSAFLRHANFSNRLQNLYFCGGSVHPGGGIPLCLLSAKIVDEVMHDNFVSKTNTES